MPRKTPIPKSPPVNEAADEIKTKSLKSKAIPKKEKGHNPQEHKSETEHPKSEIKEMEVHHHPEVENKGLKEYLLEGLMIFLAVFMGFIAENIREDYTEHKKAQDFAVTMAADLTSDTANLKDYLGITSLPK